MVRGNPFASSSSRLIVAFCSIGLSACGSNMNLSDKGFDACRVQCSTIDWGAAPSCLDPKHPSREQTAYARALARAYSAMRPPKGVCGCFTAVLSGEGKLNDVEVVYSNWPNAAEFLTALFKETEPIGAPPADASCLVGIRIPGAFAR